MNSWFGMHLKCNVSMENIVESGVGNLSKSTHHPCYPE